MNYAKDLPVDKRLNAYPAPPPYTANQAIIGVPTASSVITLNDKTTVIELTAIGGQSGNAAIIGKWGSASVTSSNFDFVVGSGNSRIFVVPQSTVGTASIAGANVANGLYPTVALKTATAVSCSVISVEY